MSGIKEVWIVSRLMPEQSDDAWELDGVYDTKEAALAACRDEFTAAARFEINKDYRNERDFEVIGPGRTSFVEE